MGLEDMIEEVKDVATGQGGNDGDNNANNSDGSNKKTEDTMIDSGTTSLQASRVLYADVGHCSHRPVRKQRGRASWFRP